MNRSVGSPHDAASEVAREAVPAGAPDALAAVATVAAPRLASAGGASAFVAFAAAFLGVLLVVNVAVSRLAMPDYGAWTGVVQIEQKLRRLEHFARKEPVDLLVLSSSLGDHGFSAVTLSEERARARGRPWRVFNLSTGGADLPTCPLLYRLVRTVARPREVMVLMPADPSTGESLPPSSPAYFLDQAPVGTVIRHPYALLLSGWFWSLPLVHGAWPLRDYAAYGSFKNRTPSNSDLYAYSEHGDTLNYDVVTNWKGFAAHVAGRERRLAEGLALYRRAGEPENRRRVFLADRAVDALRELMALVRQDGGGVSLVAHDATAGLVSTDPAYPAGRRPYYLELSQATGLPVIDFLDAFRPLRYEIADGQHLNVHGARRFAQLLAARLDGRPDPEVPRRMAPDLDRIDPQDPTFNAWSAVVVRDGQASYRTLEIRVVQSLQTLRLAIGSPVQVVLRQPDNSDLGLLAKVVGPGLILADASPVAPGDRVFVLRIVSLSTGLAWHLPLAGYRWSNQPFPVDSVDAGPAKLLAEVDP